MLLVGEDCNVIKAASVGINRILLRHTEERSLICSLTDNVSGKWITRTRWVISSYIYHTHTRTQLAAGYYILAALRVVCMYMVPKYTSKDCIGIYTYIIFQDITLTVAMKLQWHGAELMWLGISLYSIYTRCRTQHFVVIAREGTVCGIFH